MKRTVAALAVGSIATLSLLGGDGCGNGSSSADAVTAHDPSDPPGGPSAASPGEPSPAGEAPRDGGVGAPGHDPPYDTTPAVVFVGRFDKRDPAGPACGWPGCRIVARFDGTSVTGRLREITDTWMEGAPSEWDVAIDGVWRPKLVLTSGTNVVTLASDLSPGIHTVELYKRSEAQNGVTQFLGFDFGGGHLVSPPPHAKRRIEIIGDSAVAGFGIEGVGLGPDCPGADHGAQWQNFHLSVGARLGAIFGADVYGTVYSGKGISRNIWTDDKETMPILFRRANPIDPTSTWDFSLTPDVVVVMMGGNDFAVGQPYDLGPATLTDFTRAYEDLVGDIRAHYPRAPIVLGVSPSVSDAQPPGHLTRTNVTDGVRAVVAARLALGDKHVTAFVPPVALESELTACNGHGNPAFHERVAKQLAADIAPRLGW